MKVYVLREEDLYAGCDCGEGECGSHDGGTVYDIVGVYSSKEKAEAVIKNWEKTHKEYIYASKRYFDIKEMELDK